MESQADFLGLRIQEGTKQKGFLLTGPGTPGWVCKAEVGWRPGQQKQRMLEKRKKGGSDSFKDHTGHSILAFRE